MEVSVVVPTKNSAGTIEGCLQGLVAQEYKGSYEVIVVDDGSTDATLEVLRKFNVIALKNQGRGPAAARNTGIKKAKGEIVAFLDDDCIPPVTWVANHKEAHNSGRASVVAGPLFPYEIKTATQRYETIKKIFLYGLKKRVILKDSPDIPYSPSANLSIRKSVLEEVGYFDEDFLYASNEDVDLCCRVLEEGYGIIFNPTVYVYHQYSSDFYKTIKKQYIHGREDIKFRRKHNLPSPTFRSYLWEYLIPLWLISTFLVYWLGNISALIGNIKARIKRK